ncbi:MAG: RNA polymerase sigma factor [Planctomycetes bacterium]|nr:RNA polymerase sigma factor [Planctomycetota bacterium]
MADQQRDESLMAEVARGKPEALGPLIRRHATPLLTFLTRMVRDSHRGEELFQEVCLAVWIKRHRYEYPRPFKSWLYAIALNRCREDFRRVKVNPLSLDDQVLATSTVGPIETAIAAETATLIDRAVALLPLQQRTVVVLRVWQQMPYADIAQILETSEGAVKSNMHHGLAALRRFLEPRLKQKDEG